MTRVGGSPPSFSRASGPHRMSIFAAVRKQYAQGTTTMPNDRIAKYTEALEFAERHPNYFPIYTREGKWHHEGELWTDRRLLCRHDGTAKNLAVDELVMWGKFFLSKH